MKKQVQGVMSVPCRQSMADADADAGGEVPFRHTVISTLCSGVRASVSSVLVPTREVRLSTGCVMVPLGEVAHAIPSVY